MPGINDLIQPQGNPNELPAGAAAPGPLPPGAMQPSMGGTPPPIGAMPPSAGAPPSPMGGMPAGAAGAPPGAPAGGQLATPAQMAEIKKLFGTVQNANSKLVSGSLMDRNKLTVMRKDLMMKLFDIMKQAGVDPANPLSVKSFLEQLDQQDPDLLAIFEQAFAGLSGNPMDQSGQASQVPPPGTTPPPGGAPSPTDLMGGGTPPAAPGGDMPVPAAPGGAAQGGPNLMDRFQTLNRMG